MELEKFNDIFGYIQCQEQSFKREQPVYQEWEWNFINHIKQSIFYLFGRLMTGNTEDKPVKNIVRRILKFRYAIEDIDVKNINIGGTLVQRINGKPVKVPLQNIAFCDQSNLMGAPFGIRISMNPAELLEMKEKGGWGNPANRATMSIEELIVQAQYQKDTDKNDGTMPVQIPGKYLEVYQVWGMLPSEFIGGKEGEFSLQLHFITFLKKDTNKDNKVGITLFAKEDKDKKRFKFIKQDDGDGLENRALGYGGVEELFEAQAWTNSSMIWKTDYLRAASKIILQTDDDTLVQRHPSGLKDMDNLEIIEVADGKRVGQIDSFPRNFQLFDNAVKEWEDYAQNTSFANTALLGEEPNPGTPFRSLERQVIQGKAPHEESVKEFARFIEEIYTDWIIPDIAKILSRGTKFLTTLDTDELEWVLDRISANQANKQRNEMVINGEIPTDFETLKQQIKADWQKKGNVLPLEILKDELKNVPLKVHVDVAGKVKNVSESVDKLTNIWRQVFANPAILQDERAMKMLNKIMQYSNLDAIDFGSVSKMQPAMQQLPQQMKPQMSSV